MADQTPDFTSMSDGEKIGAVLTAAAELVPADAKEAVLQLVTPQALEVIAGVIVLWGASHFFGFGEVFDLLLLVTGVVALGHDAFVAVRLAIDGFRGAVAVRSKADVEAAAGKIAQAFTKVGVDMIATVLFRWKRPNVPNPLPANFPRAPAIANNGWRYRPQTFRYPFKNSTDYGFADFYGDIHINTNYPLSDQQITLFHEQFHALLAPKLDILRRLRAQWTSGSYNRSYLRQYLEEALAEASAQVRDKGLSFGAIAEGFRFPLAAKYYVMGRRVTLTKVFQEIGEDLLDPIKVDEAIYNVSMTDKEGVSEPRIRAFGRDDLRPSDIQGGMIHLPW